MKIFKPKTTSNKFDKIQRNKIIATTKKHTHTYTSRYTWWKFKNKKKPHRKRFVEIYINISFKSNKQTWKKIKKIIIELKIIHSDFWADVFFFSLFLSNFWTIFRLPFAAFFISFSLCTCSSRVRSFLFFSLHLIFLLAFHIVFSMWESFGSAESIMQRLSVSMLYLPIFRDFAWMWTRKDNILSSQWLGNS